MRPRYPGWATAMLLTLAAASGGQAPGTNHAATDHVGMTWGRALFVLFDQLEYAPASKERTVDVNGRLWYGGAYRRLWLRARGEAATTRSEGLAGLDMLAGKLVDPFWDAVVGVHVDTRWGDLSTRRVQLALGLIGLAPYRFELEPTMFVSADGDVSGRLEAAFPLLLTQRLIAEPEFEINAALQAVPAYNIRRGVNDYEFGVRVRHEFRRELAPYVGWSRSRRMGVAAGGAAVTLPPEFRLVLGMRVWR